MRWKPSIEPDPLAATCAELDGRVAELEAALRRLWDVGRTVTVDGERGCFVSESEWRRLVVDQAHG
jgi:hypothetical protein